MDMESLLSRLYADFSRGLERVGETATLDNFLTGADRINNATTFSADEILNAIDQIKSAKDSSLESIGSIAGDIARPFTSIAKGTYLNDVLTHLSGRTIPNRPYIPGVATQKSPGILTQTASTKKKEGRQKTTNKSSGKQQHIGDVPLYQAVGNDVTRTNTAKGGKKGVSISRPSIAQESVRDNARKQLSELLDVMGRSSTGSGYNPKNDAALVKLEMLLGNSINPIRNLSEEGNYDPVSAAVKLEELYNVFSDQGGA